MRGSTAQGTQRPRQPLLAASGLVLLGLVGFTGHAALTAGGPHPYVDSNSSIGVLVTADAPMREGEVVVVSTSATTSALSDIAALERTTLPDLPDVKLVNPMPAFANSVGVSAYERTIGSLGGALPVLDVGFPLP